MSIVVLDGYTLNPGDLDWSALSALGPLTVHDITPPQEVIGRIGGAQVVLTNKTVLGAEVFDACPRLRYVGVLATGYNVVDLDAATRHGVCVTNVPAYSTPSVAQAVFALLLEISNQVGCYSEAVHAGKWANSEHFCFYDAPLMELSGKTLGIVGLGATGRQVACIGAALGMDVIAYDHHAQAKEPPAGGAFVSLGELFARAHVLTLHCPLTEQTRHMINRRTLAEMREGAILINTARGGLIDEAAVRDALLCGRLYALGADVAAVEPIAPDSPLLSAPRCFLTPHIAWATPEARARLMRTAVDNVRQFLAGREVNRVNHPL